MRHRDFFCRQKKSEARRATEEDSMYPAPYDCLGSRLEERSGLGCQGGVRPVSLLSWYTEEM